MGARMVALVMMSALALSALVACERQAASDAGSGGARATSTSAASDVNAAAAGAATAGEEAATAGATTSGEEAATAGAATAGEEAATAGATTSGEEAATAAAATSGEEAATTGAAAAGEEAMIVAGAEPGAHAPSLSREQRAGAAARSGRDARGANSSAPADADRLSALRADELPAGFELADEPRDFVFPRDHGPHPTFRHEWWYITGHLDAANGDPFGFELTFFRFALKPPGDVPRVSEPSAWRSSQIYMAHFAVTDIARDEFKVSERFARDALGLAGAQADPFRVSLDDWSLGAATAAGDRASTGTSDAGTGTSRARGGSSGASVSGPDGGDRNKGAESTNNAASNQWHLKASDKGYTLNLTLTPASPIMLNGNAGLSQKAEGPGAASYYYSIPRMTAQGKLVRDGKELEVKGTVWLDREWGSGSLGGDQQGWDWYALQLDDGSALMFYALRKRDGARDAHSSGTWLAPDGSLKSLTSDEVQIDVKNEWTSPRGGRYPARWQFKVPSLQLDLDIEPRLADQELNTSTRYWEGASTVRGTRAGKPITGKAYVELVGYATRGEPQ